MYAASVYFMTYGVQPQTLPCLLVWFKSTESQTSDLDAAISCYVLYGSPLMSKVEKNIHNLKSLVLVLIYTY